MRAPVSLRPSSQASDLCPEPSGVSGDCRLRAPMVAHVGVEVRVRKPARWPPHPGEQGSHCPHILLQMPLDSMEPISTMVASLPSLAASSPGGKIGARGAIGFREGSRNLQLLPPHPPPPLPACLRSRRPSSWKFGPAQPMASCSGRAW